MTKSISITCKTGELIEIAKLERFQGDLKEITPESMDKLRASIIKYGFSFPIFLWQTKILDGHQRLEAAKQLIKAGHEIKGGKLPVVQIEAESDQEAAEKLLLINSRYAQMTQAGFDAFVTDFDIDLSDFSELLEIPEIDFDFDGGGGFNGNADPDDVPEVQPDIVSKQGDIWILGEHRLMCGDSTLIDDFERLMAGEKAQMIFTDPPYGVDYTGGAKKRERLTNDNIGTNIYYKVLPHLFNFTDKKTSLYLWYADGHAAAAAAAAAGFIIVAQIIWAKNNAQFVTSAHYKGKHEPCYYAHKKNNSCRWHGPNNEVTLWEYDRANKNEFHPTQKPVAIAIRSINNSTLENEIVIDAFSGGGTTIIAAQQTKRRCFAMEISERYCDVSIRRWQDFTGQQAVLESTGEKFDDIPARRCDNDK